MATREVAADMLREAACMTSGNRDVGTEDFWLALVDLLSDAAIERLGKKIEDMS